MPTELLVQVGIKEQLRSGPWRTNSEPVGICPMAGRRYIEQIATWHTCRAGQFARGYVPVARFSGINGGAEESQNGFLESK